jgi:PII-like signaling protein
MASLMYIQTSMRHENGATVLNGIVGIDLDVAYGIAFLGRPVTNAIVRRVLKIRFAKGVTIKETCTSKYATHIQKQLHSHPVLLLSNCTLDQRTCSADMCQTHLI